MHAFLVVKRGCVGVDADDGGDDASFACGSWTDVFQKLVLSKVGFGGARVGLGVEADRVGGLGRGGGA